MAESVKVIDPNSGSGYDYTSLFDWEAAQQADIDASGTIAVAKCRCTGGTADTTAVTIDGWTTSTDDYIKIWTDPAESYRHGGTWPTGNIYRISTSDATTIDISDNHVKIIGIAAKIYTTAAGTYYCIGYPYPGIIGLLIDKCYLAVDVQSSTADTSPCFYSFRRDQSYEIRNTIGVSQVTNYNHALGSVFGDAQGILSGYTKSFYNCTAIGGYRGFYIGTTYTTGQFNVQNCLASGFYLEGFYLGTYSSGTISNNASTDTTAPGTSSRNSQDFTFMGAADFHLAPDDAGALGYGVNLYSLGWQDDIDGQDRGGAAASWDIGADEYFASVAIEQEGFRFRNDDGSESAATWKANQDTNITLATNTPFRLRKLLNATGDPASIGAQFEYRYKPSGGAFGSWTKVN